MLVDLIGARELLVLSRQARREILVLHHEGTVTAPILEAAGRGIQVRCVTPAAGQNDWPGVAVRTVVAVPRVLFLFDRQTALVPADEPGSGPVLLRDRASVALMCELFERIWCSAVPAGWGGLTEQQSAAVRLLAEGHTDEAVASRLGVSSRTVRRIVTELIERLGARGRFQAGVHAARAGWLAVTPLDGGLVPAVRPDRTG